MGLTSASAFAQGKDTQVLATFERNFDSWAAGASVNSGGVAKLSRRDGHAVILASGSAPVHSRFFKQILVEEQTSYRIAFDGWAGAPRNITLRMRYDRMEKGRLLYTDSDIELDTERRRHEVVLTVPNRLSSDKAILAFLIGDGQLTEVYIDNIEMTPVNRASSSTQTTRRHRATSTSMMTPCMHGSHMAAMRTCMSKRCAMRVLRSTPNTACGSLP